MPDQIRLKSGVLYGSIKGAILFLVLYFLRSVGRRSEI